MDKASQGGRGEGGKGNSIRYGALNGWMHGWNDW